MPSCALGSRHADLALTLNNLAASFDKLAQRLERKEDINK